MVRPSPAHLARLRLTTKQVNGGYYKGNRTGSMGAHTEWGGYVIDYRKVRNFNCPDSKEMLTPFVTAQIEPPKLHGRQRDGEAFIEAWKTDSPVEYDNKKEQWREYLERIEEIEQEKLEQEKLERTGKTSVMQKILVTRDTPVEDEPPRSEDDDYVRAREDAVAQSEDSSKSKSWLARVFRR